MNWHTVISDTASSLILAALAVAIPALAGYIVAFVRAQLAKLKIQISDAEAQQLKGVLIDGATKAEEWAATQAKLGRPVSPSDKLSTAIAHVVANTDLGRNEAADKIQTILPTIGLGAASSAVRPLAPAAGQ